MPTLCVDTCCRAFSNWCATLLTRLTRYWGVHCPSSHRVDRIPLCNAGAEARTGAADRYWDFCHPKKRACARGGNAACTDWKEAPTRHLVTQTKAALVTHGVRQIMCER